MKKVPVRFVKVFSGYYPGDVAGFTKDKSAELIKLKFAVPFVERAAVTKAEPAPEPEQPKEVVEAAEATEEKPAEVKKPRRGRRKKS